MNLPGVVTLVAVTILTLSVWAALLRIIRVLHEVSFNLGTIVALINAIGRQTSTVTPTIAAANTRLTPVEVAAAALGAKHGSGNGRVVDLATGR
ncbi:MAG TPA: hypothetical protein VFS16_02245 [Acidimicrobiia bacterium]|nr:hypothetical protein [Acidimicrobiia bacterium]